MRLKLVRLACLGSVLLALISCGEQNESGDKPDHQDWANALSAFSVTTAGGVTYGQVDQDSHAVYLRHIFDGTSVKSAEYRLADGSTAMTDLSGYYGAWPEHLDFVVSTNGKTETYDIRLCDFVSPNDYYLPKDKNWVLTWTEEFTAPEIDWNSWERCPRSSPDWASHMCDLEELGYIDQSRGALILKGVENTLIPSDTARFLTGGIWGKNRKFFKLGRIDVRVRYTQAQGFWNGIWMMPNTTVKWPYAGEIDIMEHVNYMNTIHQAALNARVKLNPEDGDPEHDVMYPSSGTGYVVVSVEFLDNALRFRVNDEITLQYRKNSSLGPTQFPYADYEYYAILSAQMGGSWAGEPVAKELPGIVTVDFVRFYQHSSTIVEPDPGPGPIEPDPGPGPIEPDPSIDPESTNYIEDPVNNPYQW